jgi:thiol-disulfide isomerase/thioredoxin
MTMSRTTDASRELVVPLSAVADAAGERRGMTNLFLDSSPVGARDSVQMPKEWQSAELDDLIRSPGMRPIGILKFKLNGDTSTHIAVDTVGDLDFRNAPVLSFSPRPPMLVANIELTVSTVTGSQRRVPYQVLRADKYIYARVADYRAGVLRVDGREYGVQVRNQSRGRPFYAPNPGTVFLVDQNGDGRLDEAATLTIGGRPMAAERALENTPFEVGGRYFEIAGIDSVGSTLLVRPSTRAVAVAINHQAPELRAKQLDGVEFRLSRQRGKLVLISFWATDCPYSEKSRSASNDLVAKYGSGFVWVAIARDTSRTEINAYLAKSPMRGIVTLPDSSAWATFDPLGATPTFVVVDERGIVRFRAEGASAIALVEAKLDELIAARR